MAEGRMLKKEISDSKKLGLLGADRPRVLYFMMLPHLDIEGRLKADPEKIKGQICTMLHYSAKSIQTALEALHNVGLIILYQNNGTQFLEYTRFGDFQKLYPNKEAETKIPDPTPANSGELQGTPPKVKLSKVKLSKDNNISIIFEKWNFYKGFYKGKANWKSHNKLSYEIETAIAEQLKHYSVEDLSAAIGNYAAILLNPDYRVFVVGRQSWDKYWTLREFLTRGPKADHKEKYLYRFLPTTFHKDDFLTVDAKNRRYRKVAKKESVEAERKIITGETLTQKYKKMPLEEARRLYKFGHLSLFEKNWIKKVRPEVIEGKDRRLNE